MNRDGPRGISAGSFWVLMIRSDGPAHDGLDSLRRLAQGTLEHSGTPDDMWAWVAEAGGWWLLFHASAPRMAQWAEEEIAAGVTGLTTLTEHVWAVHDSDARWDEVNVCVNGAEEYVQVVKGRVSGFDGPLGAPPEDSAVPAGENAVWALVREHTGLTLADVQGAIPRGQATWLVHRRTLVDAPAPLLRDAMGWKVRALVLRLSEVSALPEVLHVCRELAAGADAHRPAEEYLRWTFVITHQDHVAELALPPEDPAVPAETTSHVPGLLDGIVACLSALPAWSDVVPPAGAHGATTSRPSAASTRCGRWICPARV